MRTLEQSVHDAYAYFRQMKGVRMSIISVADRFMLSYSEVCEILGINPDNLIN